MRPSPVIGVGRQGGREHRRARRRGRSIGKLREPEVEHLDASIVLAFAEHDVGRLQIAMRDALLVRGGHGIGDGNRDLQQSIERTTPSAAIASASDRPFDQLHRQEELAIGLFDGMDGDDAGMVERGDGLRFALEPFAAFRVVRGCGRQQLERH